MDSTKRGTWLVPDTADEEDLFRFVTVPPNFLRLSTMTTCVRKATSTFYHPVTERGSIQDELMPP